MFRPLISLLVPFLCASALAAAPATPSSIVEAALSCNLPMGKADQVEKALARLGAKPGTRGVGGEHVLPAPVRPFGLSVTQVSASADDVEIYIATLPGVQLETVAKAANLKKVAGGYGRDTKHGTLLADVREHGDVWLICTVTQ